jgi:hypothetical protein
VTLIMMKSYIIWYYCRLTCTFENERQLSRWVWTYIAYVAIQFLYNVLWHGRPWPRYHPDVSGGVFGPFSSGSAHIVGYLSAFGLLLLTGWWVSKGRAARPRRKWAVALLTLVVAYNLIFMTDTKHALLLFPLAAFPFLLHPKFPVRLRINLILSGVAFMLMAYVYFQMAGGAMNLYRIKNSLRESPKGEMMYALTTDFRYLVPYPLLGAGPGRFASNQAVAARAPLARRYIIPHLDSQRRMGYFKASGTLLASSILGIPQTDLFILLGEYGWLGGSVFYLFWGWVVVQMWKKSAALPLETVASGYFMALSCCLIFLAFTTTLLMTATIPVLAFPLWILIGRMWDMKLDEAPEQEAP